MKHRGLLSVLILSIVLAGPMHHASAQQSSDRAAVDSSTRVPQPVLQELLDRLKTAEERIKVLERGATLTGAIQTVTADPSPILFDDPIEERLTGVESDLAKIKQAEAEAEEAAAKVPSLKITGRVHLDAIAFPESSDGTDLFENPGTGNDPQDSLFFRRLRVALQGDIFENMRYKLEVDFNNSGTPELKDNFIGFTGLSHNQSILFGIQKRPLGLDHLNSSRYNIFLERPLVVEAFNEDARRLGAAAYGHTDDEAYNWRYGVYNLENIATDGRYIGDSLQLSANARISGSPLYECDGQDYFHWALSGMVARPDGDVHPDDTNQNEARFRTRPELRTGSRWINTEPIDGADWYEIMGLESMLNLGPFHVVSEYQFNWLQRDDTGISSDRDLFFHGAYIFAAYMLTGEHVPYSRKDGIIGRVKPRNNFFLVDRLCGGCGNGWGAWQIAARYSYLDLTDHDIRGGDEENYSLALVWYFNSHSSLQFNAVYGEIEDHEPIDGFDGGHFLGLHMRLRVDF